VKDRFRPCLEICRRNKEIEGSVTLRVLVLILALVGLLLLLSGCREWLVNRSAFFPDAGIQIDSKQFAAPIETVYIQTEDGVRISGFLFPREGAERAVLFLHGNAGNASHRLPDAFRLWSMDANVLLLDYRGYGISEGRPSERGVNMDGKAGLEYLSQRTGLPMERIVLFGRSLGSAVAVDIARDRDLAGLILVSPISSGIDVARMQGLGWLSPLIGDPFNSVAKIAKVRTPVLVIHGDRDRVIPVHMGRRLYEAAPGEKEFHLIAGAEHNDLTDTAPGEFFRKVETFLRKVTPDLER